jgi:G3E family GTPase
LHDRQLPHHFFPGVIVTLVDSEHIWQQAQNQPEWLDQVSAADWLVLSKTNRTPHHDRQALLDYLRQLNPLAQIAVDHQLTDGDLSLFDNPFNAQMSRRFRRWLPAQSCMIDARPVAPLPPTHPLTTTCVITFEQQIDWSAFVVWLSMLLYCHGQSILRMKGMLNILESETPVVIHGVQHSLHPPVHLSTWPDNCRQTQIVFIMRDMTPERLQKAFQRFLQPYTQPPQRNHLLPKQESDDIE